MNSDSDYNSECQQVVINIFFLTAFFFVFVSLNNIPPIHILKKNNNNNNKGTVVTYRKIVIDFSCCGNMCVHFEP